MARKLGDSIAIAYGRPAQFITELLTGANDLRVLI